MPQLCAAQVATGTYLPGALWVYEATRGLDLTKLAPDVHVWAELNPLVEEKPGCAKKLCPSAQQAADEKQRVKNALMGTLASDITGHFRADIEATRAAVMAPDEELPGFGNVKSYLKAISRKSKKAKKAITKAIKFPWSNP